MESFCPSGMAASSAVSSGRGMIVSGGVWGTGYTAFTKARACS